MSTINASSNVTIGPPRAPHEVVRQRQAREASATTPAAATQPPPPLTISAASRSDKRLHGSHLAFGLLVLALAVLFIRPAEILPAVEGWQFYEIAMALCCVVSIPILIDQAISHWRQRPINTCVVLLLPAIVMSHLSHAFIWGARHGAITFGKVVLLFLLIAGLLSTPDRLRRLLAWISVFIVVLTALALLQYHEVINLPALAAYQDRLSEELAEQGIMLARLCSTGIFNDPNDLCLVLVFGAMLCLYWFEQQRNVFTRVACLGAVGLFFWALALTHSRGGFVALLAGMLTLAISRLGWKRSFIPILLLAPLMFMLFGGRQTELSATEGTGLARLQLWSEALTRLKNVPLFGMGMDQFAEDLTLVVHNSFLHCFVELGMFGGTLFLGAFVTALFSLRTLGQFDAPGVDPALVRLRPYLLATVVAYSVGMLSLSRSYSVLTYVLLGITAAYVRLATPPRQKMPQFGINLLIRFSVYSIVFLAGTYMFIRLFVRWGT